MSILSMVHGGFIYVMTNQHNTVLYTGVTSDLYTRVIDHKEIIYPFSFTARYRTFKLIYYECFYNIEEAIAREKQFKRYNRFRKMGLIRKLNPMLKDLTDAIKYW